MKANNTKLFFKEMGRAGLIARHESGLNKFFYTVLNEQIVTKPADASYTDVKANKLSAIKWHDRPTTDTVAKKIETPEAPKVPETPPESKPTDIHDDLDFGSPD